MAAVDSLDNILDLILLTEVAEMKDTPEEEDRAQDSVDKFLDLLNPTALKEMKGTVSARHGRQYLLPSWL